jgi:hypothetical protein
MTKRVIGAVLLVCCMALALPGMALASLPHPKISGVHSVYVVNKGHNLTVTGLVTGKKSTKHWDEHAPFEVEKRVKGRWVDLMIFRPKSGGSFKFTLNRPPAGTYRVRYDGCEHYSFANDVFRIKGGTDGPIKVVKLDPALTVDGVQLVRRQPTSRQLAVTSEVPTMALSATIHTGLPAEAMIGNHLTITALASLTGATYTVVWTNPAVTGFGGSTDITVSPIVVPQLDGDGHWYNYFKVRADWGGNDYTNAGSATSNPWGADY